MALSWSEVVARLKFYGPDGAPDTVNGVTADGYGGAFSADDEQAILDALQPLYANSPQLQALLSP
jgi:hypothetical protein